MTKEVPAIRNQTLFRDSRFRYLQRRLVKEAAASQPRKYISVMAFRVLPENTQKKKE
jgi:hypothetical protein